MDGKQDSSDKKQKEHTLKRYKSKTFRNTNCQVKKHLCAPLNIVEYSPYLTYGSPIQLKTDLNIMPGMELTRQMVLSVSITDEQIARRYVRLGNDCLLTVSDNTSRLRRNIFAIESVYTGSVGQSIWYGDDVYIRLYDSASNRKLYLKYVIPIQECFGGDRERFYVKLSEIKSKYCIFKITHYDLHSQTIMQGSPVPSNGRICFRHYVTHKYLTCENRHKFKSLLGTEKLASGYVYLTENRKLDSCHYWIGVTKGINEDERTSNSTHPVASTSKRF